MASNPTIIPITEKTWTKVADNITRCTITRVTSNVKYFRTYRLTGEPTPTGDGVIRLFEQSKYAVVEYYEAIDVWLWCDNSDSDTNDIGEVEVSV